MLSECPLFVEDETCPVSEQMLGQMYRAGTRELDKLIATVPSGARVSLALYCYRRAHLESIGLSVAATCERDDLAWFGGYAGAALFERSRKALGSQSKSRTADGSEKTGSCLQFLQLHPA
jgi:hypothetical protein